MILLVIASIIFVSIIILLVSFAGASIRVELAPVPSAEKQSGVG
jgi:hypothetical protein